MSFCLATQLPLVLQCVFRSSFVELCVGLLFHILTMLVSLSIYVYMYLQVRYVMQERFVSMYIHV